MNILLVLSVLGMRLLTNDDGFGDGLQRFAKSDKAKAEFLLRSVPSFYANTIENIRAKDYGYDDVARKLREYISVKQKARKEPKDKDTVILKLAERERERKLCGYCRAKGWRGMGHIQSECFTKRREMRNRDRDAQRNEGQGTTKRTKKKI